MADDPDNPDTPDSEPKVSEATADRDDVDGPAEADAAQVEQVADVDDEGEARTEGRLARWRHRATRRRLSRVGAALVASSVIVATLAGLAGWLGYRAYQKHEAQIQRDLFVQVARQGAVNLTTIDYTRVDADVQRVLDLATGAFRDDFEQRSKPFIEVVKAAQSKSEGTVTDAGLESQRGDSAQVLVAVAVKSRTAGGEQSPREWRMRIEVRSVGDDAKVSNVVFVP
ncbi:MAG TPA: Mce protein [Mycobacterium sp.]|nr:Mce protein [Mycobacterium sp.]HKI40315.1 Mce protein [Mycobacterium sp.]